MNVDNSRTNNYNDGGRAVCRMSHATITIIRLDDDGFVPNVFLQWPLKKKTKNVFENNS